MTAPDIKTAFQLLDMIQGHPGYVVTCYVCKIPMTDWFGVAIPSYVGMYGDHHGMRHHHPAFNWCPYDRS